MTRKRTTRPHQPRPDAERREFSDRPPAQGAKAERAPARAPRDAPKPPNDAALAPRREPRGADVMQIYGFHSVSAALGARRRKLVRLYATQGAAARLASVITACGVEVEISSNEDISSRAPRDAVHQGLLLETRPLAPIDISELPAKGIVLVLDQITDPHNVGAILRTAAAFAVEGLVTTERHSPEFSGALAKSASGGLEHVPICSVVNLARAMGELKEMGYLCVGLDSDAPQSIGEAPLTSPLALVLGAEGKGMRRLTRENCDFSVRLDLPGAINSLNVSNACAIALALAHARLNPHK